MIGFSSAAALAQAPSKPLELADGAPERHIVLPGDTLWSIAAKFLKDPYRWSELWRLNPEEVKNPHRIYPGQVLSLDKSGNAPRLLLETVKLRPHEYVEPLKKEISSIPAQVIEPFLTEPLVVEPDGLDDAARVVAIQDGRVIAGAGDRVFVTNVKKPTKQWQLFRPGSPLVDPDTKEVLGLEALYLGLAQQISEADPAEFVLRTTKQEVMSGDRLLPAPRSDILNYIPRAPERQIAGRILGVKGGINFAGKHTIVSINRGKGDGVEIGHVFSVEVAGKQVDERFMGEKKTYQLPDQRNGLLFVFRVFNRVSYALVMESVKPISVGDAIRTP
jgi:nucleoid-associated protein YgaU